MRVTPRTDEEVASAGLLPDGDYDFEILDAGQGHSKAGNDMLTLTLRVFDGNGGQVQLLDYLVEVNKPLPIKKMHSFVHAVGLDREYRAGDLPVHSMAGRTGRAKIGHQQQEGYDPRNQVVMYLTRDGAAPPAARPAALGARPFAPADLDDEVPF